LLVVESFFLFLQRGALGLQLVESFEVLVLVGLFEGFLGGGGRLGVFGDVLLVPVELGPGVARRSFLSRAGRVLGTLVLLQLLPLVGLLLDLLLVLRLFFQRLGRVH
jgi:hypothetical protein